MTGFSLGMLIELVVAVLLAVTIGYCVILNKRLMAMRADEEILRATISELITATEIAERAIFGMKAAAANCEATLGSKLKAAEAMSLDLDQRIDSGDRIVRRIAAIAGAATPPAAGIVAESRAVAVEEPASPARNLQRAASEAAERLAAYRRNPREAA